MTKVLGYFMVFGGGFCAALNLSHLIPNNPAYVASWVKVILCLCVAGFGIFTANKLK